MKKLILATNNQGKFKEFSAMLIEYDWQLISQREFNVSDVAETGLTFVENALIKARHACRVTGLAALADDSGLVVPALNGAPGLYSARYAGEGANAQHNITKLLSALSAVDLTQRHAYFYCVIVLLRSATDPTPIIAQGRWDGMIGSEPRGDNGFGYDPVFYLPQLACSSAELTAAHKNQISHRALALQQLLQQLESHDARV